MAGSHWIKWVGVLLLTGLLLGLPPAKGDGQVNAETTAPLKIMPLGDSITSGSADILSYRYALDKGLHGAGISFDFVGSVHGQLGAMHEFPPPPVGFQDFDWDNEGHSGWRVDDILNGASGSWDGNLQTWMTVAMPDIVLVHLGTNDLYQDQTVDSTVAEMGTLIDTLRAVNPRVKILLAQIMPGSLGGVNGSEVPSIPVFNARLPALTASKARPFSPILVVDMHTGFTIADHTRDGTHPNGNGEQKLANRWLTGIQTIMKPNNLVFIPMVTK